MTTYDEHETEDARLRILQTLNKQTDNRLSHRMALFELEAWGINRSPEWVQTQMRELAHLGAVTIVLDTAAALVIELTTLGQRHVQRQRVITGVRRPEIGER